MKTKHRISFIIGIVATIALCVAMFIYLEFSMSRVDSVEAQLQSETYTVGVDYSGIIEKSYIEEGAYIDTKDPLFELRSPTLTDAIRNNEVAKSSLLYSVNEDGLILISAAAPGQIQSVAYREGAFVPANSQIAVVNVKNKFYVLATYKLSSPDYANLGKGSKVSTRFPDGKTIVGEVYDISLETIDKEIMTRVRIRFDQNQINETVFSVGTPVNTTLILDRESTYTRISEMIKSLFLPTSGA
jgi:multidrug resistance efflux pump